jgi:hypothetical protein
MINFFFLHFVLVASWCEEVEDDDSMVSFQLAFEAEYRKLPCNYYLCTKYFFLFFSSFPIRSDLP